MITRKTTERGNDWMIRPPADANGPALPMAGNAQIGQEAQDDIGRQLRAVYNEVLDEPVPERFLKLLADLERSQNEKS